MEPEQFLVFRDGASDHSPVITAIEKNLCSAEHQRTRISKSRRNNPKLVEKAMHILEKSLPKITRWFTAAKNPTEIQSMYDDLMTILIQTRAGVAGGRLPQLGDTENSGRGSWKLRQAT